MNVFFTADQHLFHANIIKYCTRPFATVDEMNETIIKNHNTVVSDNDTVYMLGDFVFDLKQAQEILPQLRGKLRIMQGNHDKWILGNKHLFPNIEFLYPQSEIVVNKQQIILNHYPMRSWNNSHHGSWCLFGHIHSGNKDTYGYSVDIGVDSWNYFPVSFDEVSKHMKTVGKLPYTVYMS